MNTLTPQMLAQIFAQESNDPFLTLLTLTHPEIDTIRLVNNSVDIVSRGDTYIAYPFTLKLPNDDGESNRDISIDLDNVSLLLIESIRTVTTPIQVKMELILSSIPDSVQIEIGEVEIQSLTYNSAKISAKLILDSFLNTEMTSERYSPTSFPGLF